MSRATKALLQTDIKRTSAATARGSNTVAKKRVRPLTAAQEDLVGQFVPEARRGLRRLIRSNRRFYDLAAVFPAAAYVVATPHRPIKMRKEAERLVIEGAPLRHVAKSLDLPMWLRRLAPHALRDDLLAVPGGEVFSRRIANRIPAGRDANAFWLETVCFAAKAANEEFALWIANKKVFALNGEAGGLFGTLAAYAWHSRVVANRAHRLIVLPWHPEIAFDTALCAAKSWLNRLRLVMQLEEGALREPWLDDGEADGFCFSSLLDYQSLLDEAILMHNCADQYAWPLARDRCRLFSVTCDGRHVATVEIGPHPRETGILTITQLKGCHNMPASLKIWQAAHKWLSQQEGLKRLVGPRPTTELPLNALIWDELVSDYRKATDGAPWLPKNPTAREFQKLEVALTDLARRSGVRSWLFTGG